MGKLTLEINNFGPMNHAKVELGNMDFKKDKRGTINIIAGKNATGKSMLSRIIYTSIASIGNEGEKIYKRKINQSLRLLTKELTRKARHQLVWEENHSKRKYIDYGSFEREDAEKLESLIYNLRNYYFEETDNDNILKTLTKIKELLDSYDYLPQTIEEGIINVEKGIQISKRNHEMRQEAFQIILNDEFKEEQNKFMNDEKNNNISLYLSEKPLIQVRSGKIYSNDSLKITAGDVFYIETPYVLDFTINKYRYGFSERHSLQNFPLYHQESLVNKLMSEEENEWEFGSLNDENNDPKKLLNEIVEGDIEYDPTKNFIFTPNNGEPMNVTNAAAGVKIIGLLQLLLEKKLDDNSFIIMDEPEIHLHPDWQIILANTIIVLAKKHKINFHINSHSPQFIESIEVLSEKHEIKDNVNFYLMKKHDDQFFNLEKIDRFNLNSIHEELGKIYDIIDDLRVENLL